MARWIRLLSTVRGVLGVRGKPKLPVVVDAERLVRGLRGLAGMLSRRAPAVLGGGGSDWIFVAVSAGGRRGGKDRGGKSPSLGGGGGGGLYLYTSEA